MQWIDTLIAWNDDRYILEVDMLNPSNNTSACWGGGAVGMNSAVYGIYGFRFSDISHLSVQYGKGNNNDYYSIEASQDTWYMVKCDYQARKTFINSNEIPITWEAHKTLGTSHFYIFCYAASGSYTGKGKVRVREYRISHDGNVLFNSVPALCLAGTTYTDGNTLQSVTATANKPGMYDKVTGRFFVNQGTGADFTYKLK